MVSMDLTVVVATRNRRDEVLTTLPHHEAPVILVDNASTDGTADAVRATFPRVRVITLVENRGAAARNVGVRAAGTSYVAFADDDSYWQPGALRRAQEIFDAHPRLALLAGHVLVGRERRTDPVSTLQARSPLGTDPDLPGPSVLGFVGCGAIVRRTAFLEVGGFEPLLGIYGEEQLLAVDLAARGWGLAYTPELLARHFPSTRRDPAHLRRRQQRRNDLLVIWLRRPGRVALTTAARSAALACRDADERAALVAATRLLPDVLRRRRRLPVSVERMLRELEPADRR
jgi:N-acetylglucosaminyl-diphospho-decaprenol L-rhamnosyltransferase